MKKQTMLRALFILMSVMSVVAFALAKKMEGGS